MYFNPFRTIILALGEWRMHRIESRPSPTHGTTSPYISLSLIAEAIEAIEVIEAIEAIGAIEAIWRNGDHAASIASIAPAIEAIGAI